MEVELHPSIVRNIVSAFHQLTALMQAKIGDQGAVANAKQAAMFLDNVHPDIQSAYHEALVTATQVAPVPMIPVMIPLLDQDELDKKVADHKKATEVKKSPDLTAKHSGLV